MGTVIKRGLLPRDHPMFNGGVEVFPIRMSQSGTLRPLGGWDMPYSEGPLLAPKRPPAGPAGGPAARPRGA